MAGGQFPNTVGLDSSTTEELLLAIAGLVTDPFDYIALTYVVSGDGAGEVETATYKTGGSGGVTVATITITYDSSNRISTVTKT